MQEQYLYNEKSNTEKYWCMIMVDTDNAFNINRMHTFWQARKLWPRAARFIYSTYQSQAEVTLPDNQNGCTARK